MLRLLLKINWVTLRLRQHVQIQCIVRHPEQGGFALPATAILVDGIARFNLDAEFYISESNPLFEIGVAILAGHIKKFAGKCLISLQNWDERVDNQTQCFLENSPDSKARICFNFFYMTASIATGQRKLISAAQLALLKRQSDIKEIEQKNQQLKLQNRRLRVQLDTIQTINEQMQNQRSEEYQKSCNNFNLQIEAQTKQLNDSRRNLQRMAGKMDRMEQVVQAYGKQFLINQMNEIIKDE